MCEKCPDPIRVGMFMVNRGPGTDDYVPQGKVYLIDGWVTKEGDVPSGFQEQTV
jgi:hypothetical protein